MKIILPFAVIFTSLAEGAVYPTKAHSGPGRNHSELINYSITEARTTSKECNISKMTWCTKDKTICGLKVDYFDCNYVSFQT